MPPWDFRVDGVTEISADIHKYGYAPKGASVVLHRDPDWFEHQVFLYDQWPSGLYGSPGVAGARSAAPIATAWAVLRHLGWEGYVAIMRDVMATTVCVRDAIASLPPLALVGDPIGPVLACTSSDPDAVDIGGVGDAMDDRGWHLNRLVDSARLAPHALACARPGRRHPRGGPRRLRGSPRAGALDRRSLLVNGGPRRRRDGGVQAAGWARSRTVPSVRASSCLSCSPYQP